MPSTLSPTQFTSLEARADDLASEATIADILALAGDDLSVAMVELPASQRKPFRERLRRLASDAVQMLEEVRPLLEAAKVPPLVGELWKARRKAKAK